jgi:hypothetical protein
LVGPQEELRGPSGYTPRGFYFEPRAGGKERIFGLYNNKQTIKQTNKFHCGSAVQFGRESADHLMTAHNWYEFLLKLEC